MKKTFIGAVLAVTGALFLLTPIQAFACSAGPCADGSVCSGTFTCTCAGGTATCVDYPPRCRALLKSDLDLQIYLELLSSTQEGDTFELQLLAKDMQTAIRQKDVDGYIAASFQHDLEFRILDADLQKVLETNCDRVAAER